MPITRVSHHWRAVLQALLVTFLWSTSWVLIKIGLKEIPPLTFAGLRYSMAFLCLLLVSRRSSRAASLRSLSRKGWVQLIALGLIFYAVTQGAQFVGLAYLPAMTVNLLLSFTSAIVALMGIVLLAEHPSIRQWSGVVLSLMGALIYFYPASFPAGQVVGFIAVAIGVLANAGSSILGRHINRTGVASPLIVTTASMGIGAMALLVTGIVSQGLPRLSLTNWAIVVWLAIVNTAFAFTLWNHTLRTLTAMESSIINNTMIIQIAILAWLFLGEQLTWQRGLGLALAAVGALIVQLRRRKDRRV